MKKFFFLFSFIAVLLIITGCDWFGGKSTTNPQTEKRYLNYDLGTDSQTWDPGFNSAADGGHIIMNMFEGLFRATAEGQVLAGATSYEISTDLKTYTFHLRTDAKWSNGEPVTSEDYKFAWLRVIDGNNPSDYSYIMSPYIVGADAYMEGKGEVSADTVGIETPDAYTLIVNLNNPTPYFLQLLSFYTYMPVYHEGSFDDGWEKRAYSAVSNGPFSFVEYKYGDYVLLEKNEYYWNKDNVKIDGVKFMIIKDSSTALAEYNLGNVDVLDQFAPDAIAGLLSSEMDFSITADIGTYYYNFNMDDELIGTPAGVSGLKIRQALSMAVDRKAIVDNVTKGYQIPAVAFVPNTLFYSDGTPCGQDIYGIATTARIAEAQALLIEAGYDTPEKLATLSAHITLGYNQTASDGNKLIAEAIQEMWKQNLGIEVQLVQEEWKVYQETRRTGGFTIARSGWLGDYPDPNTMLDLFTSYSGQNDSLWRWENGSAFDFDTVLNPGNQAYDEAIEAAMISSGAERDQHFKDAERILLVDECAVMPLYWYSRLQLVNSDHVTGVVRTQMGHWYFGDAEFVD